MGTFITASGNLAEPPTLAHDEQTGRPYAYLRVLVSTDYRDDAGAWRKNPPTEYRAQVDVSVRSELHGAHDRDRLT